MYAKLQKMISSVLYLICLFLCCICLWKGTLSTLWQTSPYQKNNPMALSKTEIYTPKDLGITPNPHATPASLHAKGACLLDAGSGRILFQKNGDTRMPMASTTKIMTCILALESGSPKDVVTFSAQAASMPDVQLHALAGESFYLEDLLYSLMLESHNDTAVSLAEKIGGSTEKFARLMNQKATELGLTNTHFVTPNGLDAKEHYTTPKELCLLAAYAMKNETFRNLITTQEHTFTSLNKKRTFHVTNHDAFLTGYEGAIGIKTGFTNLAGYCFCGAAKRGNTLLISSVLASGWPPHKSYKWSDTRQLMDYGFKAFTLTSFLPSSPLPTLTVIDGQKKQLPVKRIFPQKNLQFPMGYDDTLRVERELKSSIQAPVRKGDIIGYETLYMGDTKLQSIPLAADAEIQEMTPTYMIRLLYHLFLFHPIS